MAEERPWVTLPDGLKLNLRLTPKSGRDAIEGVERLSDGRAVLKVRVRAAPSEGEANTALLTLLTKSLRIGSRNITIVAGATARVKQVKIEGDAAALASRLERITGAA
jgi:uncharacterized protein